MLDNNQKVHPKKFQRFGSSNRFLKVSGRTARNCLLCEEDLGIEDSKRVPITHIDQCIMNPISFPIFEREITDIESNVDIQQCLLRNSTISGHQFVKNAIFVIRLIPHGQNKQSIYTIIFSFQTQPQVIWWQIVSC